MASIVKATVVDEVWQQGLGEGSLAAKKKEQRVTKYMWLKSCDEEEKIKQNLHELLTKKGISHGTETGFCSNELNGGVQDIHDVAYELKSIYPGKVALKDYPPFGPPDDDPKLIITVTVTLNFAVNDGIARKYYHCEYSDLEAIATKISQDKDFQKPNYPTVNIVVKDRPPQVFGNVWSYCPDYIQSETRLVADVSVKTNIMTGANLGKIVKDAFSCHWNNYIFVNEVSVDIPNTTMKIPFCEEKEVVEEFVEILPA